MGRSAVWRRGLAWLVRRRVLAGALAGAVAGVVILLAMVLDPRPIVLSAETSPPKTEPRTAPLATAPGADVQASRGSTDPVPRTVLEHGEATLLETGVLHEWWKEGGEPATYRVGGVTLTWAYSQMTAYDDYSEPWGLTLKISAPGLKTRTIDLSSKSRTEFGVGRIDPTRPGPQVVFTTDSGGRGCCTNYYLLTPGKGVWRLERLGRWNFRNDGWPTDRDGDGAPEFVLLDEAFFPYPRADIVQLPPPRFIQVRDGKAVDVSHRPGFARYFRQHVSNTLPECRKRNNFACASLVAAAARIGRKDWAWGIMLKHYDGTEDDGLWVDCHLPEFSEACATPETLYPVALRETLIRENYWPGTVGKRDAAW